MRSTQRYAMFGACLLLATSACKNELTGPSPSIESPAEGAELPVDPGIICSTQHAEDGTALAVSGTALAPIPFDIPNDPKVGLPDLNLTRTSGVSGGDADAFSVAYGGEPGESNSSLLSWTSQSSMGFRVTDDVGLQAGIYDLTITNANGEAATSNGALAVVDRPTPVGITPGLICLAEADRTLTLAGENFLRNGDASPVVSVGDGDPIAIDSLADCAAVAHEGIDAEICDSLEFTLPQDSLEAGSYPIVVTNPETAACESIHDEDSIEIVVVGPPVIETAEPASLCSEQTEPVAVTFNGANFINANGENFAVTINGESVTPDMVSGCEPIEVDGIDAENCTSFTVTVDPSALPQGAINVTVANPESVGCGYETDMVFTILGPPVVTGVMPSSICSDQPEEITISGENFGANATVTVGGEMASTVDVQDSNTIVATFENGVPAGSYDVTVDNGAGCDGTLTSGVLVEQSPLVFFVDPPVVYNGVAFEVTIFTSGLTADAAEVYLIAPDGTETQLTGFQSPQRPNRILATIPDGLAPGEYEVGVTSDNGCLSAFNGTVTISDNLNLNLDSVDPPFASPTADTPVTITATAPPNLVSTPRAYLNPNPAAAGVTATALEATVFVDNETLTAVVPGGLAPGSYDLIVVNPTGEVGLLSQGLTVTPNEPPVIDTVTPQSFANNIDYSATIAGANFDAAGVTVGLDCEAPGGTRTQYAATVNTVDATTATATLPTSQLSKGTVCLVTLTNDAEGTSFSYSAISITNSAFNLEPWSAGTDMTTGRRALSLEAGRPTRTSRQLYAIGGDDGTNAGAFDSVESASVDVFGNLGTWSAQRYALPGARSFASIERVGRFLYLTGGYDGATAVDTTWRAQVLSPLETPEFIDIDAALGDGSAGLGEGLWIYRVAAVFPATDENNPSGESLPGEVQNVDLPQVDELIQLTLTWEPIDGAAGYRIYRSPMADTGFDEVALVAEINDGATTTWTDDGATADTAQLPLPSGSLGQWHPVGNMTATRAGHATAVTPVPGTTDQYVMYAFGGRDAAGTNQASIEFTTITDDGDGTQTVAPWTPATQSLSTAKADFRAFVIRPSDTAAVPAGTHWIYVGPGDGANDLQAFEVPAGLDPSLMSFLNDSVSASSEGYAAGASNGSLYIFGGAGGNPTDGGISAEMCDSAAGPCNNFPPDLQPGAWNSLGTSMSDARLYHDAAQESAFYFVAGGTDGTNALTSVDTTVQ